MDFTGRPLRGMIYVRPAGLRQKAALSSWVELALQVAEADPPKKAKKPK
jgi:hypothetical protein